MRNFLLFIGGVIVGAGATYLYQKNRYEEMIQEEVESLREHMREKECKCGETCDKDMENPDAKKIESDKEDIIDYPESLDQVKKIINYNKYSSHEDEITASKIEKTYVVTPEEFASIPGFDTDTFYYHHDDIISNENQEMVDDVENILGLSISDIKAQFGVYEDDAVYIRNMELQCDYEILREESDFTRRNRD